MSFGILSTGLSGLRAAQSGLDTTGHNIANVNTDGYNRQRIEQVSTIGLPFAGTMLGNGTQLSALTRAFNDFAYKEVLYNVNQYNYNNTQMLNASRLDNLVADTDTGITTSLETMFDSINGVTEEPTIISARNVLLANAESLAKRFNNLATEVERQHLGAVNQEIYTTVASMNEMATRIAELNKEIAVANSVAESGFPANDLLDKRDLLIKQISEKCQVSVIDLPDGTVNLTLGKGITLVTGTFAIPLTVERNEFDTNKLEISISPTPTTPVKNVVTSQIAGGSLGGLFTIRDEVLLPALRDIGKLAIGLADSMNRQQTLGRDLNGNVGENLFTDINDPQAALSRVLNSRNNPLGTDFSVRIDNASLLTNQEYRMEYDGTNLAVYDADQNVIHTFSAADIATMAGGTGVAIPSLGLSMTIPTNNLAAGDSFMLRPTFTGARDIAINITDPKKVAAADNFLDVQSVTNPNNVSFSLYEISDANAVGFPNPVNFPPPATPGIRIIVDATASNYSIEDAAGNPLSGPTAMPTDQIISFGGGRLKIEGQMAGNEVFTLRHSDNTLIDTKKFGPGDNTNALAMLAYQNVKTLDGGTNTFSESYAEMVTFVGVQTQSRKISADSFSVLLADAEQRQAAVSGVNLDEEAANLIRYQQSYSAAARIISVARDTFDTLLQSVR